MHSPRPKRTEQDGTALIWALVFVVLVSGMILSHSLFLAANRRSQDVAFGREALADNFAHSGITEAVAWFRRQPNQPVTQFDPRLDESADPPVFDTIDPALGIVREFQINGSLWGRYEVRRADVTDISSMFDAPDGSVWDTRVHAFIFRKRDPDLPFDEKPNRIIYATTMAAEVRGVRITLPADAALSMPNAGDLQLSSLAGIHGGDAPAVASRDVGLLGGLVAGLLSKLTGTPKETRIPGFDVSPEAVFSMPVADLLDYSDIVLRDRESGVFRAKGRMVSIKPRTGTHVEHDGIQLEDGLLFVDGNLYLGPTSRSDIRGILFVNGNMKADGKLRMTGAMIVNGRVELTSASDSVRLQYDPNVVDKVGTAVQTYRLPRTLRSR